MRGAWVGGLLALAAGWGVGSTFGNQGPAEAFADEVAPLERAAPAAEARRTADEQAVHDAVLDYVEGVYDVAPERIERSVHPTLRKYGYVRQGEEWGGTPMTYDELRYLAATYNAHGRIGADAPKEITVFDVLDKTASAKLVAAWGVDYFHLAEVDGRWQIMNVLWQSPPQP